MNDWSLQGAFDYVDEAFDVWRERSRHAWQLDISWLETQGIKLQDKTAAEGFCQMYFANASHNRVPNDGVCLRLTYKDVPNHDLKLGFNP